ncbi:polysaccharide pyruvyl transferase family protein [Bacteroides fragilis]|nr:polysaccharide pyruvyl transferase family protein [Bacteroides fragilis]
MTYASSFGVASIAPNLSKRYAKLLNNLNTIAVREQSGVELVKQLTGREAKLVVDPTLLLSKADWEPYMKPLAKISTQYILIYQLFPSQTVIDVALKIGKEKNLPVYNICKRAYGMKKLSESTISWMPVLQNSFG